MFELVFAVGLVDESLSWFFLPHFFSGEIRPSLCKLGMCQPNDKNLQVKSAKHSTDPEIMWVSGPIANMWSSPSFQLKSPHKVSSRSWRMGCQYPVTGDLFFIYTYVQANHLLVSPGACKLLRGLIHQQNWVMNWPLLQTLKVRSADGSLDLDLKELKPKNRPFQTACWRSRVLCTSRPLPNPSRGLTTFVFCGDADFDPDPSWHLLMMADSDLTNVRRSTYWPYANSICTRTNCRSRPHCAVCKCSCCHGFSFAKPRPDQSQRPHGHGTSKRFWFHWLFAVPAAILRPRKSKKS